MIQTVINICFASFTLESLHALTFETPFFNNLAGSVVQTWVTITSIDSVFTFLAIESACTLASKLIFRLMNALSLVFARIHGTRVALGFHFNRQRLITFELMMIACKKKLVPHVERHFTTSNSGFNKASLDPLTEPARRKMSDNDLLTN